MFCEQSSSGFEKALWAFEFFIWISPQGSLSTFEADGISNAKTLVHDDVGA